MGLNLSTAIQLVQTLPKKHVIKFSGGIRPREREIEIITYKALSVPQAWVSDDKMTRDSQFSANFTLYLCPYFAAMSVNACQYAANIKCCGNMSVNACQCFAACQYFAAMYVYQ